METFGILDFLKPLLDFTQKSPLTPNASAQNNPEQKQEEKMENRGDNLEKNAENIPDSSPDFSSSQTAILNFYQAHENRAKRTRK